MSNLWNRFAGLFFALLALIPAHPVLAQRMGQFREIPSTRENSSFKQAFREVTRQASQSTVRVLGDDKEVALGTIVGPEGWVLTKFSLLSDKPSCRLKSGSTLEAKIVGVHEGFDLALLKIEASNLHAATLADSKIAGVGSWLISVGTADDPVAIGVMSVATRTVPASQNQPPRRQMAPPTQDHLGINVVANGDEVKIVRVGFQSAAARAGLKVDDRLVSIEGTVIKNQEALVAFLAKKKPGDTVHIKLVREGSEMELPARLGQRRRPDQNMMGSELSERRTGFPTFFQTDTVLKPRDCGGPVCDLEGRVVGINIARAGRVESYAIPSEAIRTLLPELKSGKLSPELVALEKKVADLKEAVKKASADKVSAEKKLQEGVAEVKSPETDVAELDKKLKAFEAALEQSQKELRARKGSL